jgi:hypothetical protein
MGREPRRQANEPIPVGAAVKRALSLLLLASLCHAQDTPKIVDKKFLAASAFSIAATMADSYTTSQIAANRAAQWNAWHPYGYAGIPCSVESNAWLYGKEPSPARAYGVGAGKIALSELGAAFLRRNRKLNKLWSLPILFVGVGSARGAIHNGLHC